MSIVGSPAGAGFESLRGAGAGNALAGKNQINASDTGIATASSLLHGRRNGFVEAASTSRGFLGANSAVSSVPFLGRFRHVVAFTAAMAESSPSFAERSNGGPALSAAST